MYELLEDLAQTAPFVSGNPCWVGAPWPLLGRTDIDPSIRTVFLQVSLPSRVMQREKGMNECHTTAV